MGRWARKPSQRCVGCLAGCEARAEARPWCARVGVEAAIAGRPCSRAKRLIVGDREVGQPAFARQLQQSDGINRAVV